MRTLHTLPATALVLLVAVACREAPPTAPAELGPAPIMNFTNGPANPSPVVMRVDGLPILFLFVDPDRELLSVHGVTEDFFVCGGPSGLGEVDLQVVDTPSEVDRLSLLFRDRDTDVAVFDTGNVPEGFPELCALLAGPLKIAQGEEDFLATASTAQDRRSVTFRFVGDLAGVDGSRIHYTEVQKFVTGSGFVVEDIFLRTIDGS